MNYSMVGELIGQRSNPTRLSPKSNVFTNHSTFDSFLSVITTITIFFFFRMAPTATELVGESKTNAKLGALGKTTSGKKLKIRSYPKFESLEEERLYRKQHLAAAFRIFAVCTFVHRLKKNFEWLFLTLTFGKSANSSY